MTTNFRSGTDLKCWIGGVSKWTCGSLLRTAFYRLRGEFITTQDHIGTRTKHQPRKDVAQSREDGSQNKGKPNRPGDKNENGVG
jgi:hypothetical protein